MKIQKFTFNPFQENTYIVSDDAGIAAIIDPGCETNSEQQQIAQYLTENNLSLQHLINTHCHIDHILGNQWIADTYNLKLAANPMEKPVLEASPIWGRQYGIRCEGSPAIEIELYEGNQLKVGALAFDILFVPGHSPGHLAFVNHEHATVFGGDVLFRGGFGRVDLPGGNITDLKNSIQNKLFLLPDHYTVYAGHMGETTIGFEKQYNPITQF